MLRRAAFTSRCEMHDMGGSPSGGCSTCPTPQRVPDVATVPVPVEAGVSQR